MITLEPRRVIAGFAFSPLASPMLYVLCSMVFSGIVTEGEWRVAIFGSFYRLVHALPLSYGITLLAGLPLFIAFRKQHRDARSYWVIAAGLIGFVSGLIVAFRIGAASWAVAIAIFFGLCGAVNGSVFWQIVVRKTKAQQSS